MALSETIQTDLVQALKQKDSATVSALRGLKAALQRVALDQRSLLTDEQAVVVVQKEIKQRRDSVASYQGAGRNDLAETELAEINILERYQPKPLTDDELRALLTTVVAEAPVKEFGPVMKSAMQACAGKADGKRVQSLLKELLQQS